MSGGPFPGKVRIEKSQNALSALERRCTSIFNSLLEALEINNYGIGG